MLSFLINRKEERGRNHLKENRLIQSPDGAWLVFFSLLRRAFDGTKSKSELLTCKAVLDKPRTLLSAEVMQARKLRGGNQERLKKRRSLCFEWFLRQRFGLLKIFSIYPRTYTPYFVVMLSSLCPFLGRWNVRNGKSSAVYGLSV